MTAPPAAERLEVDELLGTIEREDGDAPIGGAAWYVGRSSGDGLRFVFESGTLAGAEYLTYDALLDGSHLAKFEIELRESDTGRAFTMTYGFLNRCEARVRIPREATNQNRWKYEREGAWLKPLAGGDRVDLARVDEMTIRIHQKSDRPVRWCQTPVVATTEEPARIEHPTLSSGPLVDELGQSTIHDWEGKTADGAELSERLRRQHDAASDARLPQSFSRWGGWNDRTFEATGYFRTEHDGDRWWLVDPDGHPFWTTGLDLVRPTVDAAYGGLEDALEWLPGEDSPHGEALSTSLTHGEGEPIPMVNHVATNFRRVFGDGWYDRWATIALSKLREWGFNTVANWSDWEIATEDVPYVRPLTFRFEGVDTIYRQFPDVYHPDFHDAAASFAGQLEETAGDPALIGYFLGNEPHWTFADEPPAGGMLYTTETCESREELAAFLAERYGDDEGLADAWDADVRLADVARGRWTDPLPDAATEDLEAFSALMVDRLYRVLSEACREVDPNHLNLGTRYPGQPRDWELAGMRHVDVVSMNCYRERIDGRYAAVSERLDVPVIIGEWHFGALDAGLPAPGLMHVPDQEARGEAYRVYLEDAAAKPWCVGAHYFTLYDESALGRFDGENWNIGFLDVCNRPYGEICAAARRSHERLYDVAAGEEDPCDDEPEYLPRLA